MKATQTCSIDDCDRPVKIKSRGWCHAHYMRWWYQGDVAADVPIGKPASGRSLATGRNPRYAGDQVGYFGAHRRLRDERGPAKNHPCAHCGKQAKHWAYDHADQNEKLDSKLGAYSTDLSRYIPLCVPCHRVMDEAPIGRKGIPVPDRTPLTHCRRGHEMTPENTQMSNGRRRCRTCINARRRELRARRRAIT